MFAFRLHQFLSKGDTVYVTLEAQASRHVTRTYQVAASRSGQQRRQQRILLPLAFCRECGQEYLAVTRQRHRQRPPVRGPPGQRRQRRGRGRAATCSSAMTSRGRASLEQVLVDGRLPYSWLTYDRRPD